MKHRTKFRLGITLMLAAAFASMTVAQAASSTAIFRRPARRPGPRPAVAAAAEVTVRCSFRPERAW